MVRFPVNIGSYRVVRLVGSGGMGRVYEATRSDGTSVAVKVFDSKRVKSRLLRERFEVEGHVLAKLKHPHLVTVYESGVDGQTGDPYFAMDFVRDANGGATTLQDVCTRGKVTEARAEKWYRDLCDVLTYCHAQGVVHRDVKLGNVLVDAEDRAILTDFGVSRIVEHDLREELKVSTTFVTGETTGTRPVMGSYWYLAPEVRRGEVATFASDWYALGVLFFRLLTGMWYEQGTDALELLAPYDPIWRKRLEALLDEDPAKRSAAATERSAPDLVKRLSGFVERSALVGLARPTAVSLRSAVRASRRRQLVGLIVLSVALCSGLFFWLFLAATAKPVDAIVSIASKGRRPSLSDAFETNASTGRGGYATASLGRAGLASRSLTFAFDAANRFAFCPCPPGTNSYCNLAIAVTRPYWLGTTPVTRRQYFAVMGEPLTAWKGGEDAPMTYLTRDEVTNFIVRLNKLLEFERRRCDILPHRQMTDQGLLDDYEIRLPTLAEWCLAYRQGKTVPRSFPDKMSMRRAYAERGWFGQGVEGKMKRAGMRRYYESLNRPVPFVTNIWTDFPPRVINPTKDNWARASSQIPPVPVGLKPANNLGLYDMLGNCLERVYDTCSPKVHHWGHTEWGVTTIGLYAGQDLALTNPVERTGTLPLMVGTYLAPDLAGDLTWSADFDRLPHLGFRLCIGPKISQK